MFADAREDVDDTGCIFGGRRTWTTGEVEQRIGFAFRTGRWKNDDVDWDLATFASGAILEDFERAAFRVALDAADLTSFQLQRRLRRVRSPRAHLNRREQKRHQTNETMRFHHDLSSSLSRSPAPDDVLLLQPHNGGSKDLLTTVPADITAKSYLEIGLSGLSDCGRWRPLSGRSSPLMHRDLKSAFDVYHRHTRSGKRNG